MNRTLEMHVEIGKPKGGDGIALQMEHDQIRITDPIGRDATLDWEQFDAMVAEVERFRRAMRAICADVAVLPVERRG